MNVQLEKFRLRIYCALSDPQKIRYLIAGGWNTVFGYFCGIALYYGLDGKDNLIFVGITANILSITMAFLTYKLYVFHTKGNWLIEYFRTYLVYGLSGIVSLGILWVLVTGLQLPFWLSQGVVIILTIFASYILHGRFTFKKVLK